jgi:hypothetical protein
MRIRLLAILALILLTAEYQSAIQIVKPFHAFPIAASGGGGSCTTARDLNTAATTGNWGMDGVKQFGQKFTNAVSATMCRALLQLGKTGAPAGNIYCDIYSSSAGAVGSLISSSSAVVATSLTTAETSIEFTGLSAALTSGTVYFVVLRQPSEGDFSGAFVQWYYNGVSTLANNQVYSGTGTTNPGDWAEYNDNTPFKFQLFSN